MNTEQAAALEKKREEIKRDLENWLQSNQILGQNQQLICEVKLAINTNQPVIVHLNSQLDCHVFSLNGRVFYEKRQLTPMELRQICSLKWFGWKAKFVAFLISRRNNEPITANEAIEVVPNFCSVSGSLGDINSFLTKNGLPDYRLAKTEDHDILNVLKGPFRFHRLAKKK